MEDQEIVELYWNRREEALNETQQKYGRLCFKVAENILADSEDAQECINDALFALWNAIPPERPQHFAAYLCRVVKNHALKRVRYNQAQRRRTEAEVVFEEAEDILPAARSVEEEAEGVRLGQEIAAFLEQESKEKRRVFVLRYWYCAPIQEIARACGLTQSKVKSILFRLRKRLKVYLEKGGYGV